MRLAILKVFLIVFPTFFIINTGYAQLQDDFSDDNFTRAPEWSGDTAQFEILNKELHLKAGDAISNAFLITHSRILNYTEWEFKVRMAFAPSGSNYLKVYLASDNPDLNDRLNGYYLKIGESGDNDAVEVYEQSGSTSNLLFRGTEKAVADSVNVRIKVRRDHSGNWILYTDYPGGGNFQEEGRFFSDKIQHTRYFGFWCRFTGSRSDKFFFDDVAVYQYVTDTVPPELLALKVKSPESLRLTFSETLNISSAENILNYRISGIGPPVRAELDSNSQKTVLLYFEQDLIPGKQYTLIAANIKDQRNNKAPVITRKFTYTKAQLHDIVISEIFPEPEPSVNLPAGEFVELYNRTAFAFSLKDRTFSDKTSTALLPDSMINPGEYIILCSSDNTEKFKKYGKVIGLHSWPSLNNDEDILTLKDSVGDLMHRVHYRKEWYQDRFRENGGWTLEMIDHNNLCGEADNWKASLDPDGGTPGKENSVEAENPDTKSPELLYVAMSDANTIRLTFNEQLNISVTGPQSFLTDNWPIDTVYNKDNDLSEIYLVFEKSCLPGHHYELILKNITDCAGNAMPEQTILFGLPVKINPFDIVLNEILFNPRSYGADFAELYNRSDKIIDLAELKIANTNEKGELNEIKPLFEEGMLFLPGTYLVLTEDPANILAVYQNVDRKKIIRMNKLPSMGDKKGTVILFDKTGNIIDRFDYKESYHFPLISNPEGVSLERIHYDVPTQDSTNWHSASGMAGYATPTYQNSQFGVKGKSKETVSVSPEVITPNSDGTDDFATISYQFKKQGSIANIQIFDVNGKPVRQLINNELLQKEGALKWDGLNDNNEVVNTGIYIIYFEAFNLDGEVVKYKLPVVVGGVF